MVVVTSVPENCLGAAYDDKLIGDHGFLHTLNIMRKPNLVGDTIWWGGIVVEKYLVQSYGLVKVELKAVNQMGFIYGWRRNCRTAH